jgi:DNA-binding transcriptional LysR family regulator
MEPHRRISRRIKLRDLDTLEAVIEAGSMAKAAAALAISQSAISKALAEMERTLGVALLERTTRGVEPTPSGRILLQRGHAMRDELDQALTEIAFLEDPASGELRIGTTEPMSVLTSRVIDELSKKYPRAVFDVLAADTNTLLAELRQRNIELAVSRMTTTMPDEDLLAETLFHDPLVVIAGKDAHRFGRRRLRLAQLRRERWVLGPRDGFLMAFIEEAFRSEGEELPRSVVRTYSIYLRNSLVANGGFLTIAPRAMLSDPACGDAIKALRVDLPTTSRPIGLLTLKRRRLSPLGRIFAETTRAAAKRFVKRRAP